MLPLSCALNWDAPMTVGFGAWETAAVFRDAETFTSYSIPHLFNQYSEILKNSQPRLALTGYNLFREDTEKTHEMMDELGIPHLYEIEPEPRHRWSPRWVERLTELMLARRTEPKSPQNREQP